MKTTSVSLNVSANVDCPHCNDRIDLLNPDDTSGVYHNEDSQVLDQAFPASGSWLKSHRNFELDDVKCSNCGGLFNAKGMVWE